MLQHRRAFHCDPNRPTFNPIIEMMAVSIRIGFVEQDFGLGHQQIAMLIIASLAQAVRDRQ